MLNEEFYNSIAESYSDMVSLEKQIKSKISFFKQFINDKIKTAVDLGSGSGADSIALAKLGLKVTAFEPSTEMVKQAKENFNEQNVQVDIYNNKIADINKSFHNSFDLVVSLGNTFANINNEEIEQSVVKVLALLKSEGKAIIQLLNYEKILKEKERIINISESGEMQFIRFYDFIGDSVFFNILSFRKDNFQERQLITTEMFPYTKSFLEKLFNKNNFSKIEFFGDMKFNQFNEKSSKDLIIILEK